jgi:hypothetical protein
MRGASNSICPTVYRHLPKLPNVIKRKHSQLLTSSRSVANSHSRHTATIVSLDSIAPTFLLKQQPKKQKTETEETNDEILDEPMHDFSSSEMIIPHILQTRIESDENKDCCTLSHQRNHTKSRNRISNLTMDAETTANHVVCLIERLRDYRESRSRDCVRLRSGQYPFKIGARRGPSGSSFGTSILDVGNPRNRARSYLDCTVLGICPYAWVSDDQSHIGSKVSILGFVHHYIFSSAVHHDDEGRNRLCGKAAWICFTKETMQEQRIGQGTQLRIYDAIVIPFPDALGRNLVMCTQLCEEYPSSILPPLPTLEQLIETLT